MKYLKYLESFNKAVSPSDLIESDDLYASVDNYLKWQEMMGREGIEAINNRDIEVIGNSGDNKNESSVFQESFSEISYDSYSQKVFGDEGDEDEDEKLTNWIEEKWDKFQENEIEKIANLLYTGKLITNFNRHFIPSDINHRNFLVRDNYRDYSVAENSSFKFLPANYIRGMEMRKGRLIITKLKDEWFYIDYSRDTRSRIYFECDQFSGLIDCLESIKDKFI